ncbi:hypothetical protein AKN89_06110 [Thiopseudomonas alkaliphila]|nr:hypothetical protein AKN92_05870 [Thiopseudomonas alkaliphila]AKX57450.1 hypothetical protein AKN89_06110 [Thiopseudomonas alkaliphila]
MYANFMTNDLLYKTSLHFVKFYRSRIELGYDTLHSRIFEVLLHPEAEFICAGQSKEVANGLPKHKEHVVPCAVLRDETYRLIKQGRSNHEIAKLLSKHWKVIFITKDQAYILDSKQHLNLKHRMPEGWDFDSDDTFARIKLAKIELVPTA